MTKDQQIIFEVSPAMKRAVKEKLVREGGTFRELGTRLFSEYLQRENNDKIIINMKHK